MRKTYLLTLAVMMLAVVACSEDDPQPVALEVKSESNFEAPGDVYDYTTQPPTLVQENDYQYYDFSTNSEVSATGDWDIAIKGTTIITNGGINGDGGVQATTVAAIFDELYEVPASATFAADAEAALAINKNTDFANRWYSYANGIISPVPGRVVLIKDTEGNYVKLEIQCYYRDCPTEPTAGSDNGIYTFRYVYQPDGSMQFDFTGN